MKKALLLFGLILFLSCEKTDDGKKCWDCYYFDIKTLKPIMPSETFCDLTVEQLDSLSYDPGKCKTISRTCYNKEFSYAKPY